MKNFIACFQSVLFILLMAVSAGYSQTPTVTAVDDTVHLVPGIPVTINLLANDIYPAGDSIVIVGGFSAPHIQCLSHSNGVYTYVAPTWGFGGTTSTWYLLRNASSSFVDTSMATVYFVIRDNSYDSLDLNNVNARFNAWGNNFWRSDDGFAGFEVPKYSGKTTIFNSTLWLGGYSPDDSLHLAAERYRQGPTIGPANTCPDFYAGPVMDSSAYSIYQDTVWNYIWKLYKTDIEYHKAHWSDPGYVPIHDILTWPGNGNTSLGQAANLAPFFDSNNDGLYNPYQGDYPLIRGDEAVYYIFNDDRGIHKETHGARLKIEVHYMGYVFDMPEDTSFKNTVFANMKIFNRSATTYHDCYIGLFTDIDLGYAADDYTGCDVDRGFYYNYNGTPVDGSGQPESYGADPPAQAVVILAGPFLDPDGIDNPKTDIYGHPLCNESINGAGFGDSIIDNERYGMTRSVYFNNTASGFPTYMMDPGYAKDYYKYMLGIWMDGTPMIYGGNGHPSSGGYGPEARFMFPGTTDSLNWGTGCVPPNGPKEWTDNGAGNVPGDRRGMASMGPFTFLPGAMQEIDVAYTFARDFNGIEPKPSLAKLGDVVGIVRNSFLTNTLPNGNTFFGINDKHNAGGASLKLYPNPAGASVYVNYKFEGYGHGVLNITNSQGTVLRSLEVDKNQQTIRLDLSGYPSGLYIVTIHSDSAYASQKLLLQK